MTWKTWLLRRIHAHPYRYYEWIRRFRPLVRVEPLACWVVTRTPDVVRVLKDPERFSSRVMAAADPYLLGADPPEHARVRRALQRALGNASSPSLEQAAERVADDFDARVRDAREIDLMSDLAAPLPIVVMASILGVDQRQHQQFAEWSHAVVAESSRLPGTAVPDGTREKVAQFDDFVGGLITERQRRPGKDAISTLLSGTPEDRLTALEAKSLVRLLLIAGNETTTHLIGNAFLALARGNASVSAPDSASRVERVVEETLRYDPPVQFLMRVTTRETDLAGTQLPAGAMVMTLLGATGRDARQHAHPHRFDSNRASSTHLAFGVGPHACPGASLARMEARVALNRAIRAVPKLRLAKRPGAVVRSQSLQLRGLQHLWVEVGR